MATYNLPLIAGALIVVYLISLFLSRQGKYLSIALHRKIWNAFLVITFILTALSAIFYLLSLDYNVDILPRQLDVSFWHIEFGLAFILIGAFHALWHIPYFAQYLPKEKPKAPAPAAQQPMPAEPSERKE
jgi:hypothetical protein